MAENLSILVINSSHLNLGVVFKWYVSVQAHTILLVQPGKKPEGRTYSDYENVDECLEGK